LGYHKQGENAMMAETFRVDSQDAFTREEFEAWLNQVDERWYEDETNRAFDESVYDFVSFRLV